MLKEKALSVFEIDWKVEFETGVEVLDNDHKDIIQQANKILLSKRPEVGDYQLLLSKIENHFRREEKLMMEKEYPGFVRHMQDHQVISDKYKKLLAALKVPLDMPGRLRLASFIMEDIAVHVKREDKKMADHIR
ncbi:MAG: hemerythrin domain-containing protein [Deltaproteobacteria bacterium]|nr:hemerythrin domain-containing protein [Deltaproteobacteria bacterium]